MADDQRILRCPHCGATILITVMTPPRLIVEHLEPQCSRSLDFQAAVLRAIAFLPSNRAPKSN
jgi:hypothetical protein